MALDDDDGLSESHFVERLTRLEEKHSSLHDVVHEDHIVVVLMKDAITAMRSNLERVTDLLDSLVARDKLQQDAFRRHDLDITAIRHSNERAQWAWGVVWKVLAIGCALFISINSGGDLIVHHILGFPKP